MAKQIKFDEKKYEAALKTLAEQLVAMTRQDYGDDEEFFLLELDDYLGDTIVDLKERIQELT